MAAKLRLGMIGTGVAARELYLPALRAVQSKVEVVACTNRTRRKAVAYAKLAGIPRVVSSAEELLALPEVDAVMVSLPIDLQPEMVRRALAAGKPVMSEKPVAPNLVEGRKLVRAAARSSTPWLVGENYAFMPAIARAQKWIEGGKLGQIHLLEARQVAWLDKANPYFKTSWRQEPRHIGGFITDAGVHLAHALRRLGGTPTVIKHVTAQFRPTVPPIDTAVALLSFPSGALGTWLSCFSAHHGGPMVKVYGSRGTAELGYNTARFVSARGKEIYFESAVDSFALQFSHFADVVRKGVEVAYPGSEALLDLEMIAAIVR